MSGVWVLKNGVYRLNDTTKRRASDGTYLAGSFRKKEFVHLPSGQMVSSYRVLLPILHELGWERYQFCDNPACFQYHKPTSVDLINLPNDFSKFTSIHMYDIVVKIPDIFLVRDV